jgi:hypothetical protein
MPEFVQPESACPTCWRTWLNSRPRKSLGYCWHGAIAWRVRPSGEFITAPNTDKDRHLAMIRALDKREPQGFNVSLPKANRSHASLESPSS